VLIPDDGGDLPTLLANAERLLALGKQVVIDPLLPPLLLGFTDGILRYAAVRKQFPNVPMLMGCGNVTELADADSTGLNAVLIALATELDIDYVLTTEASPRTRGAVKEIDRARRLMHAAKEWGVVPKHLDDSLLTIKDPATPSCTEAELREMQSLVTDANYRIFTAEGRICVFNAHRFICHPDAASVGNELALTDPAHAFYLGKELYKAELALRLGKKYVQDSELRWGYLSDAHSDL
jgi:dihydropteroate synthase-like protein